MISLSPSQHYYISEKEDMDDIVKRVGEKLLMHGRRAEKLVIYCRYHRSVRVRPVVGSKFTDPEGFYGLIQIEVIGHIHQCHRVSR